MNYYLRKFFLFGILNFLATLLVVVVFRLGYIELTLETLRDVNQWSFVIKDFLSDLFVLWLPFSIVSFSIATFACIKIEGRILRGGNLISVSRIFLGFLLFLFFLVVMYALFLDGKYYHYYQGKPFVANFEDTLLFMFIAHCTLFLFFGLRLIVQTKRRIETPLTTL